MHVTLVHVHVQAEHLNEFLEVTLRNHRGARAEPGNVRFDVLQSADDPTRFVFVEVYRDETTARAHKDTPHYLEWRDTVKDWMVTPREGRRYNVIAPIEAGIG
jgi:autoinducer 2-degrading protein